jgi:hypothetical protein
MLYCLKNLNSERLVLPVFKHGFYPANNNVELNRFAEIAFPNILLNSSSYSCRYPGQL